MLSSPKLCVACSRGTSTYISTYFSNTCIAALRWLWQKIRMPEFPKKDSPILVMCSTKPFLRVGPGLVHLPKRRPAGSLSSLG